MPQDKVKKKEVKKTTSKALPGSGLVKSAGRSIEKHRTRMEKMMRNL